MSFFSLVLICFLGIFVALDFLGVFSMFFCLFYRDFKGSQGQKILDVFVFFLGFSQKTKEKKDRAMNVFLFAARFFGPLGCSIGACAIGTCAIGIGMGRKEDGDRARSSSQE